MADRADRWIEGRLQNGVVARLEIAGERGADGLLAVFAGADHVDDDALIERCDCWLGAVAAVRRHDVVVLTDASLACGHAGDRRDGGDLLIARLPFGDLLRGRSLQRG